MDFAPRCDKVEGKKTRRGKAESEKVDSRKVEPIRINTIYPHSDIRYSKNILSESLNTDQEFKANPDFVSHFYSDENKSFNWKPEYKRAIKNAIQTAANKLEIALKDEEIENNNEIKSAIEEVIKVLKAQDLKIYPLDEEECCGMAMSGENAISINIELLSGNSFGIAKTLIHEAFHIIGGCDNEEFDNSCSNFLEKYEAWKLIGVLKTKDKMCADAFAQFIMRC